MKISIILSVVLVGLLCTNFIETKRGNFLRALRRRGHAGWKNPRLHQWLCRRVSREMVRQERLFESECRVNTEYSFSEECQKFARKLTNKIEKLVRLGCINRCIITLPKVGGRETEDNSVEEVSADESEESSESNLYTDSIDELKDISDSNADLNKGLEESGYENGSGSSSGDDLVNASGSEGDSVKSSNPVDASDVISTDGLTLEETCLKVSGGVCVDSVNATCGFVGFCDRTREKACCKFK